ncbi:MAG: arsenical pump-driving ATPase [Gammaproteobacteria bacterium]
MPLLSLLDAPARYLFFTGKGGVGKTSLATASAIAFADGGRRVLLVSTDPASNLDEILGVALRNSAIPVAGVERLELLNIDPQLAAEAYRARVLEQMGAQATAAEIATVREELAGACTTEIAAFDAFAGLLAADDGAYDNVVFDTAPSGHTLRLLSLPQAWTGFLTDNTRGASCLGPHSGLEMQESMFRAALATLTDARTTTVVLVARPEAGAIAEAARTAAELTTLGLTNQCLIINGVFHATGADDAVASAIEAHGRAALETLPAELATLPRDTVPLRDFDVVGLAALRALLEVTVPAPSARPAPASTAAPHADATLGRLADELAANGHGLIMVMGKGGVGKTTIAAALAIGLVDRGHAVHLSTTDPAAHLTTTLAGQRDGLTVSRIDPAAETQRYIDKIMANRGARLSEDERALLLEDLRSPCTEEVAVFHAFSRIVAEARSAFVVLDTAPTGHSLLLMDATGAYHRQVMRGFEEASTVHIVTPLMRLQDPDYTRIVLVTLPETIPVSQAAALQDDLRRAEIEPYAWVVNRSILAAGTSDPLLRARLDNEQRQMARMDAGLAARIFVIPWLTTPPVGLSNLAALVD